MVLSLDELLKKFPRDKRFPHRDVKALYKQYLEEEIPSLEDRIREILGSYEDHLELVRSVASCFLPGTELSNDTGYEFRFTEPLSEKDVKNFDMLITERKSGRVLFVESKTFTGSVTTDLLKDRFVENRKRMQVVEKDIQTLSEKVGHPIDKDSIEVAMIVDIVHLDDIMREYHRMNVDNRYKPIIFYLDKIEGTLNMAEGFHLYNEELEKRLVDGIQVHEMGSIINIPCLISDHPFQVLRNVIINDPSTSITKNNMMLKDFSMDEIRSGLEKIPLGCSRIERKRIIEETASNVINHNLKYFIISKKDGEKTRYHLLCKGNRRSVIDRELHEKYVRNWSIYKADIRARERVEEEYRKYKKLDEYR
ncbi:MAG: hypothetical protein R6V01_10740 [Thermoplasmatota archaeon]